MRNAFGFLLMVLVFFHAFDLYAEPTTAREFLNEAMKLETERVRLNNRVEIDGRFHLVSDDEKSNALEFQRRIFARQKTFEFLKTKPDLIQIAHWLMIFAHELRETPRTVFKIQLALIEEGLFHDFETDGLMIRKLTVDELLERMMPLDPGALKYKPPKPPKKLHNFCFKL